MRWRQYQQQRRQFRQCPNVKLILIDVELSKLSYKRTPRFSEVLWSSVVKTIIAEWRIYVGYITNHGRARICTKTQNISVDQCNQWEYSVPRTSTDGHGNSEHHLLLATLERSKLSQLKMEVWWLKKTMPTMLRGNQLSASLKEL